MREGSEVGQRESAQLGAQHLEADQQAERRSFFLLPPDGGPANSVRHCAVRQPDYRLKETHRDQF
jgi:hypothetical protein